MLLAILAVSQINRLFDLSSHWFIMCHQPTLTQTVLVSCRLQNAEAESLMRRARERERQAAEQDNRRERERCGKTKLAKQNTFGTVVHKFGDRKNKTNSTTILLWYTIVLRSMFRCAKTRISPERVRAILTGNSAFFRSFPRMLSQPGART